MSYYILSIHSVAHDGSYALFDGDKLIQFAQGERSTRKKYDDDISFGAFDQIYENVTKELDLLIVHPIGKHKEKMLHYLRNKFKCKKIISEELIQYYNHALPRHQLEFSHHDTHALSAFYMSPFDEAVCLVIDALGSPFSVGIKDWKFGILGSETSSIIEISKNYERKLLYKRLQYVPARVDVQTALLTFSFNGGLNDNFNFEKSLPFKVDLTNHMDIGNMYHTISHHLGFGTNGCGKVMGLSAYGRPDNDLPPFLAGDTTYSNNNFFALDRTIDRHCYPELYQELSFQQKADLAYEVQKALEKIFLSHAEFILQNSKSRNLIIGGGCALNILGISAIKKKYPEFNIFVDPIANDATHPIGLAMYCYNAFIQNYKLEKKNHFDSIYLGPKYNLEAIKQTIDKFVEIDRIKRLIPSVE